MRKLNSMDLFICPDCGEFLDFIYNDNELIGLCCHNDKTVFPINDGIIIILPKDKRNYSLEFNLVEKIRKNVNSGDQIIEYCKRTTQLFDQCHFDDIYEWDEEEYWSREYDKRAHSASENNWNERIWDNEFMVRHLLEETTLSNRVILDVGSGEGQLFRRLVSRFCDYDTLYIATDISLSALRLNRSRNTHKNSIYVLCSAEKLPLRAGKIDVLCYFGILHHTKYKAENISNHIHLVKSGGYILLCEALQRPSLFRSTGTPRKNDSPHEERIEKEQIIYEINKNNLEIVASRYFKTIFYGLMRHLFGCIMKNSRTCFDLIVLMDQMFMRYIGSFFPYFQPGAIRMILKKKEYNS